MSLDEQQKQRAKIFRDEKAKVVVVGPLPPPVHGFAQATVDVIEILNTVGASVSVVNMAPLGTNSGKVRRALWQIGQLFKTAKILPEASLYLALSGGMRKLVDAVYIAIARLVNAPIFIHHHSFAYLDRPDVLADLSFRLAGPRATHITLCARMEEVLRERYRQVKETVVLSNAGLRSVGYGYRARAELRKVGYISAVSIEKGIREFVEVANRCANNIDVEFVIAGRCEDSEVLTWLESSCASNPNLTYLGPVYGEEKKRFFEQVDLLLFPTRYKNEAEPLVLWESMSAGIPVLARQRGCIGQMVTSEADIRADSAGEFVDAVCLRIESWIQNCAAFRIASVKSREMFEAVRSNSLVQIQDLFGTPIRNAVNTGHNQT